MPNWAIEVVGWVASGFVVASLTMRSLVKLRFLGLIGAICFTIYGVLLEAWPIAIVNGVIIGIQVWFLRALWQRPQETFRLLEVSADSEYLRDFVAFYDEDLRRTGANVALAFLPDRERWFVLRDMIPAGLVVGRWVEDETFSVDIDYAIPQYRDTRLGRFAFSPGSPLFEGRLARVTAEARTPAHARYLERLGFIATPDGHFVLDRT